MTNLQLNYYKYNLNKMKDQKKVLPLQIVGKENQTTLTIPLKVVNSGILVRVALEEETAGGIFLPDSVKEKLSKSGIGNEAKFFQVVDIAKEAKDHFEDRLQIGDWICLKSGEPVQAFTIDNILVGYVESYQVLGIKSNEPVIVIDNSSKIIN